MEIVEYRVTLKHDTGKINIRVSANDIRGAVEMVMAAEGCPERAIKQITRIETKQGIHRQPHDVMMKPLKEYNTAAKALLLWDLFPEETETLLQYIDQVCQAISETENPPTILKRYGELLPVSNLPFLCWETRRLLKQEGERLLGNKFLFASGLFSGDIEPLAIYCMKLYAETKKHPNEQFALFMKLLFLNEKS